MIDIHTHILPGIDDGAQDWEDTFALSRSAVSEGITTVIATPHHANGTYLNEGSRVADLTAETNRRLQEAGIPLKVLAGQEIRYHDDFLQALDRKELLTLGGGSCVLIEMPSSSIPRGLADLIHELRIQGLKPVIAHPERNAEVSRHPERLAELVGLGAVTQVTTHSLLGGFGKGIETGAWQLIRQGLIHFVSSDAHHADRRGFRLAEAYDRLEAEYGGAVVKLFRENAEAVLAEGAIRTLQLSERRQKSLWKKMTSIFHK